LPRTEGVAMCELFGYPPKQSVSKTCICSLYKKTTKQWDS